MITDSVVWDKKQFQSFGWPEAEGVIPLSSITDVLHADDREQLNETAQRVFEQGESAAEEFRIILPDGSVRWLLGSSGIINISGNRENALLIGVNMDITESKKLEIFLRESERNLRAINKTLESRIVARTSELEAEAKRHAETQSKFSVSQKLKSIGQIAGGIVHDYNNLLAVVAGSLELALPHINHAESRDYISKTLASVYSGVSLNRRLLMFARNKHLKPVDVSMSVKLLETVSLLQRTVGEKISITTTIDPVSWVAFVDPGELDSVLINLSINARDAMPEGGELKIEVRNCSMSNMDLDAYPDANPGDYVALLVIDNGAGMSDEVMQQAADPFLRPNRKARVWA